MGSEMCIRDSPKTLQWKIDAQDYKTFDTVYFNPNFEGVKRYENQRFDITDQSKSSHTLYLRICEGTECSNEFLFTVSKPNSKPEIVSFEFTPNTFTKNGNSQMTITGKVKDVDGANSVTIKYNIKNRGYQTLTTVNDVTSSDKQFSATINIPNDLPEGSTSISLIANDGYLDSDPKSKNFLFNFNNPSLNMDMQDGQVFSKNDGQRIRIKGSLGDIDGSGTVTLKYQFDGKEIVTLSQYEIKSTDPNAYPFDFNVDFPPNFPESSNQQITIWATDEKNKSSSQYFKTFSYFYNNPAIKITTTPKSSYIKNTDDIIKIVGTVSDRDGNDIIDIFYKFDNGESIKKSQIIVTNQDTNYPFNFTVQIPSLFSVTQHNISIMAVDSYQKQSNISFSFNYYHNTPILTITNQNDTKYIKNVDTFITITGSVKDDDETGTVYVKYKVDSNGEEKLLQSFSITTRSFYNINENIPIPSDLSEGIHTIFIWAVDNENMGTDIHILAFIYNYNTPSISITTDDRQTIYKCPNDIEFNICGSVSDLDQSGYFFIYYKFDNSYSYSQRN